jgi:cbb3-type cytochrome oxidase maturation protein
MRILLILIPVSLALLGIAMAAFAWAVRSGQFDDLDAAPLDVLGDERSPLPVRDDDAGNTHAA